MKAKRHNEITELIKTREIGTQEELLDLLKTKGYDVTQATISRDIRELNLTKVNSGGKQKYAVIIKDEECQGIEGRICVNAVGRPINRPKNCSRYGYGSGNCNRCLGNE